MPISLATQLFVQNPILDFNKETMEALHYLTFELVS